MKIKLFVWIAVVFSCNLWNAQTSCNCNEALQKIILKIESEYPGFDTKTKDKFLYETLKKNTLTSSDNVKNDEACLDVLKSYTDFFKDRHIWVLPNQVSQHVPKLEINTKLLDINLKKFKKDIQKQKDKFEGIWKNEGYEIGVKKINDKEYVGFIIKADPKYWKPNEIKFRLFSDGSYEYYSQDHSIQKGKYTMYDNTLLSFNEIKTIFVKQLPHPALNATEIENKVSEINGTYIKKVSSKTVMIRLQYFSYSFVDSIEKLLKDNKKILEAEFWIIDVRGNGGGTDNAYRAILPYIMTNSIRKLGVEYLASPTLIQTSENYLKGITKDSIKNKEEIINLKTRIAQLKNSPGEYVNYNQSKVAVDSISLAVKSPAQIVILADNHTGSAAENFLLSAKQSKKVKIMGRPSSGVLDYANAMFFDYGCNNYKLLMPTYRSFRLPDYPIDNIGVQPDIYLDESVKDWVQFAVDYLEN